MRGKDKVVAIVTGDLHLRHTVPISRAEKSWYPVMAYYLRQIQDLHEKYEDSIVIYPGDIFDNWNPPAELINFALENLPTGYAIPGQHDLPYHRYTDIKKSGYWTLADRLLIDLTPDYAISETNELHLHGFPWGFPVVSLDKRDSPMSGLNIAILHDYVFYPLEAGHPGVSSDKYAPEYAERHYLDTYDVAVIGDNHKHFHIKTKTGTRVWNGGAFIRSKSDEMSDSPVIGLITESGKVTAHHLQLNDKWAVPTELENSRLEATEFLNKLSELGSFTLDFVEEVIRRMDQMQVNPQVREMVLKSMENKKC